MIDSKRLIWVGSFAMSTIALLFYILVRVVPAAMASHGLNSDQIAEAQFAAAVAFVVSLILVGLLMDTLGIKAFLSFGLTQLLAGTLCLQLSFGRVPFLFAFIFLGAALGAIEPSVNSLAISLGHRNKFKTLGIFHAWWAGGILSGFLLQTLFASLDPKMGWRLLCALPLFPAFVYGFILRGQTTPQTERETLRNSPIQMFREGLRPILLLFLLLALGTVLLEQGGGFGRIVLDDAASTSIIFILAITFLLRLYLLPAWLELFSPLFSTVVGALLSGVGLTLAASSSSFAKALGWVLFSIGMAPIRPTVMAVAGEEFRKGGAFIIALLCGFSPVTLSWLFPQLFISRWASLSEKAFVGYGLGALILLVLFFLKKQSQKMLSLR